MELASRFHDDHPNVHSSEAALESLETRKRVGDTECLANWMEIDIEAGFTNVDPW